MKLSFLGDVMLGRGVNEILREKDALYPWGDTLPLLRTADLRMCNLECVISDRGMPQQGKAFTFRSDAKNIAVLRAAKMNAVSLANNHALDYGYEALEECIGLLERERIAAPGVGGSDQESCELHIVLMNGDFLIGILAATDNEERWAAGSEKAGICFFMPDMKDPHAIRLVQNVRSGAASVPFVIVSLHWGSNWGYHPETGQQEFAHTLIDAGARIVFGHSPHVYRGVEFYGNGVVLYSAGDFIDDYAVHPIERNDQSCIFLINVHDEGAIASVQLYPIVIERCRARLARGEQAQEILRKMEYLCGSLGSKCEQRDVAGMPMLYVTK